MSACTACHTPIPERLYEYGDVNMPMCLECHLSLLDDPLNAALYFHRPIYSADGRQIGHTKHLTLNGVAFFDGRGRAGVELLRVYYGCEREEPQ